MASSLPFQVSVWVSPGCSYNLPLFPFHQNHTTHAYMNNLNLRHLSLKSSFPLENGFYNQTPFFPSMLLIKQKKISPPGGREAISIPIASTGSEKRWTKEKPPRCKDVQWSPNFLNFLMTGVSLSWSSPNDDFNSASKRFSLTIFGDVTPIKWEKMNLEAVAQVTYRGTQPCKLNYCCLHCFCNKISLFFFFFF